MQPKQTRRAAIDAARNTIIEHAKKHPGTMVDGLLRSPHLLYGRLEYELLFEALLEGGQHEKLLLLAAHRSLPANARRILADLLLGN